MSKRRMIAGTVLVFPLFLSAFLFGASQNTGAVFGVVIDTETGEPLSHIQVSVPEEELGALTNDAGQFILDGIETGQTTLLFEHRCFHSVAVKLVLSSDLKQRQVDIGMPYNMENEPELGCSRLYREDSDSGS